MSEQYRDTEDIRQKLKECAQRISEEHEGAPVIVIVAGSQQARVPASVTAWANLGEGRGGRLRDLVGILQTAIQIESLKHFHLLEED